MFCPKCGTENPAEGKFCRKCGTDLGAVSVALGSGDHSSDSLSDADCTSVALSFGSFDEGESRRARKHKLTDPDDLFSAGIRSTLFGIGFLVISAALFFTNVANGGTWWWAMLFPAFAMIAGGAGNIAKSKRLEKRIEAGRTGRPLQPVSRAAEQQALPDAREKFVPPARNSKFETGDLVPPSVTEGTTRHLAMESEGETMTLPNVGERDD